MTSTFDSIKTGEVVGSTTRKRLPTVDSALIKIKAYASNSGKVYIGGADVGLKNNSDDADNNESIKGGFELSAGEETGWMPMSNLNFLYQICSTQGDGFCYMILRYLPPTL